MANMSYCRFHNTLNALRDCKEALEEGGLPKINKNEEEYWAMQHLIKLCGEIHELALTELCIDKEEGNFKLGPYFDR